jgi:hypothetical protein
LRKPSRPPSTPARKASVTLDSCAFSGRSARGNPHKGTRNPAEGDPRGR